MQISSVMNRFILKVGLLAMMVVCADVVIGNGLAYITAHIKVGGQGRDNYIANDANEDILIFGSSRAVHHYNAKLLEDSLRMSCYNCGDDGCGIILSYGRLLMNKDRKLPHIIIHDVNPEFDVLMNDNHKYLGWLKTHYEKACLHPIFDMVDDIEKYKMTSLLYRYNSRFLQNVFSYLTSKSSDTGIKGFRPLNAVFDSMKIKYPPNHSGIYKFDQLKLNFINSFIDASKGSKLIFVVSPIWYGMDTLQLEPIKDICKTKKIPFYDFSNSSKYVHQDFFFKDGGHLNAIGADEFTKDLIGLMKDE